MKKKKGKRIFGQCNGDPIFYKCEERGCSHHKTHVFHGDCGKHQHNGADRYCVAPGTQSMLETGEDGGLVSCVEIKI